MSDSGELRKRAEESIGSQEPSVSGIKAEMSEAEVKKLYHELLVHQIELEMQNEELRRSGVELDIVKSRYFDLYDLAPVGYLTLSEQGLILEANLTFCSLLGASRKAIEKRPFSQFILDGERDVFYLHRRKAQEKGERQSFDMRMFKGDGTVFWAHLEMAEMQGTPDGKMQRVTVNDVSCRKAAEEKVKNLLLEKELVLREVHHRIKNNMETVCSLLSLQARLSKEGATVLALEDARHRVHAMMTLYEVLYQSENFIEVRLIEYLPQLAKHAVSNFPNSGSVRLETNVDDIGLDAKKASSLGILVNELLTNIMKYAFADASAGIITLNARERGGRLVVEVQDNGSGMPESISFDNSTGFGLMLVEMLAKQLDGTIRIERGGGTKIVLELNLVEG